MQHFNHFAPIKCCRDLERQKVGASHLLKSDLCSAKKGIMEATYTVRYKPDQCLLPYTKLTKKPHTQYKVKRKFFSHKLNIRKMPVRSANFSG